MKKYLLVLFLIAPLFLFGQDTIVTKKKEIISCEIISISPIFVTYKIKGMGGGYKNILQADIFEKIVNSKPFIANQAAPDTIRTPKQYPKINLAGEHLQKAASRWYLGLGLITVGTVITTLAATSTNKVAINNFLPMGIGISSVGIVINISSFSEIHKAGKNLKDYRPAEE